MGNNSSGCLRQFLIFLETKHHISPWRGSALIQLFKTASCCSCCHSNNILYICNTVPLSHVVVQIDTCKPKHHQNQDQFSQPYIRGVKSFIIIMLNYLASHSLHLFTLCSAQNNLHVTIVDDYSKKVIAHFATASKTCGSCSHFLRASTLLDLRCGRGARKMASAQRIPEVGHSCIAFAISVMAMFCLPPRTSTLMASSL